MNSKASQRVDVIVAGGGPAGSVLAWKLASQGVKVLVLEATHYPREKVCGDYVEPRGLRVLEAMGCLGEIDAGSPLPITRSATYVENTLRYQGRIPFYGRLADVPDHGYIVPRDRLDHVLIRAAERAGARVQVDSYVSGVSTDSRGVAVEATHAGRRQVHRGRLVVGADGVNSVVASSLGQLVTDPRHTAVAQRAYATGIKADVGEATFFFERDLFPGYGWMFPMRDGLVNVGVGILSETKTRRGINVPQLFAGFFERLRRLHPLCERLELCRPAIGGIVKTYGSAGSNHFDGGVLIGDAGCFVDPMTGEGITPAMESALLAAPVLMGALDAGRSDSAFLASYETAFRAYFNPSMVFVDLVATMMRNADLADPWLKLLERGCALAQKDADFARTAGAAFGGLEISPPGVLSHVWLAMCKELLALGPRATRGDQASVASQMIDMWAWPAMAMRSALRSPAWTAGWMLDLQRNWLDVLATFATSAKDPRAAGLV